MVDEYVTLVARVDPNDTTEVRVNRAPVMVTLVPPPSGPVVGEILLMYGFVEAASADPANTMLGVAKVSTSAVVAAKRRVNRRRGVVLACMVMPNVSLTWQRGINVSHNVAVRKQNERTLCPVGHVARGMTLIRK